MAEITTSDVREFLKNMQGQVISLNELRRELEIEPGTKSFEGVRNIMFRLAASKIVKPLNRRGEFKIIRQVEPVKVFSRNGTQEPYPLIFPRDFDTGMEIELAESVIIMPGDLVLIAGESNYGKTTLAMNFLAENIDKEPVLMGNEYTTVDGEPTPRFLKRLKNMDWVDWLDTSKIIEHERFTLLPVREDYAEHVVENKLNIIDWINIETGEHYMINTVMSDIKKAIGGGVGIAVIQKAAGAESGRGGQFTKDFADLELLIDKHSNLESRITVGKVKESKTPVAGRSWAFGISHGVKLINVREVRKCRSCYGKGFTAKGPCDNCQGGWIDL